MAIDRIQKTSFVVGVPKRIDPPVSRLFHAAPIHPKSKGITRHHRNRITIRPCNCGRIVVTVARLYPTVKTPHQIAHHAVRVPVPKLAKQHFALVGFAVVVRICKMIHVGNAVRNRPVGHGHDANRNI